MDSISPKVTVGEDKLRTLAEAKGPCITLVLPFGPGKNLETERRKVLQDLHTKLDESEAAASALLEPIGSLALDEVTAVGKSGSLIIFRSADLYEHFSTSEDLPSLTAVEETFQLRPLLAVRDEHPVFYILALSQGHSRLLRCTATTSEEVPFAPGTPVNLGDFKQTRKPDHRLDNMASGGPSTGSMRGVMSGTSSDADDKDEYVVHFFKALDRCVHVILKDEKAPLVVVAVDHELAEYRLINTYPHIIEPGVHGSPDGYKGGEMHKRALELLKSHSDEKVSKSLADFDKLVGTGHASVHAQEIVKAAHEGRVSQLLLQPNATYLGNFDEVRHKVKRHPDAIDAPRDLLNDAAIETLRHGGTVTVLPAASMPNGVPVAAVCRYPAPELQVARAQDTVEV